MSPMESQMFWVTYAARCSVDSNYLQVVVASVQKEVTVLFFECAAPKFALKADVKPSLN